MKIFGLNLRPLSVAISEKFNCVKSMISILSYLWDSLWWSTAEWDRSGGNLLTLLNWDANEQRRMGHPIQM